MKSSVFCVRPCVAVDGGTKGLALAGNVDDGDNEPHSLTRHPFGLAAIL